MSIHSLRNAVNWALMVALVLGAGAIAQAQNADKDSGKVIHIGRSDPNQAQPNLPPPDEKCADRHIRTQSTADAQYWVGLLGGAITPDHPFRAQLDLPENEGLLIQNVVPNSPAAKAGLQQYDILLKANDKPLHEMSELSELVMSEGPAGGKIVLDVLRHNKHESVTLTPEERPANAPVPQAGFNNGNFGGGFGGGFGDQPNAEEMMRQLMNGGNMQFRNFGNGVIVGGNAAGGAGGSASGNGGGSFGSSSSAISNMPNGVSITIQKQNDKPANITVKRGDETWNIVGDDPASLKQLPEDLRPAVEQMLHNNGNLHIQMPNFGQRMNGQGIDDSRFGDRLERMEQRLEEMQRRLSGDNHAPADNPNDQHGDKQ